MQWVSRQLSASGEGNGEDRLAVAWDEARLWVVVCDGAGGIAGGARAADRATSGLMRGDWARLEEELMAWDGRLLRDARAGETTAVAIEVRDGRVRGASCGDSVAFLDGVELTGEQHRKRRLGSGRALPVVFGGRGRRLLVCTDGLHGRVDGRVRAECLAERSLARAASRLVEAARLPSGDFLDDVAFVLVELGHV